MDVDSLPKALVPEGKQGGGLKIITLDKVKSCLLCGKKMLLKCAMGYGGEVPPASPARYDLTKLGEAEITGVTTPYRLYHRGGWPGWSCWHCR